MVVRQTQKCCIGVVLHDVPSSTGPVGGPRPAGEPIPAVARRTEDPARTRKGPDSAESGPVAIRRRVRLAAFPADQGRGVGPQRGARRLDLRVLHLLHPPLLFVLHHCRPALLRCEDHPPTSFAAAETAGPRQQRHPTNREEEPRCCGWTKRRRTEDSDSPCGGKCRRRGRWPVKSRKSRTWTADQEQQPASQERRVVEW